MARRYQFVSIATLFVAIFAFHNKALASSEQEKNQAHFDLILAGGGLATCSSFSPKNCLSADFSNNDLSQLEYKFSKNKQQVFRNSGFYKNLLTADKVNIDAIIDYLYSKKGGDSLTKGQISKALKASQYKDEYLNLSDPLYYALFDYFEFRQLDDKGVRKTEKVILESNKSLGSRRVYNAFVDSAKTIAAKKNKERAQILVVTASSRDPFESADFYQGVFSGFDVDVVWLPLDMSLQQAIEQKRCDQLEAIRNQNLSFNRSAIYPVRTEFQRSLCEDPEKLLKTIKEADGLFFNGGDQSRTIAALTLSNGQPSKSLKLIQTQNDTNNLVVGGTSAGTAVQAGGKHRGNDIVMLSNGDPKFAIHRGAFASLPPSVRCDETGSCADTQLQPGDLTYRSLGGTGLFTIGLLDTHFSEREREVRLNVFAHQSGSAFGFGVDEATALGVTKQPNGDYKMQVIGENGVYITEVKGHPNQLASTSKPRYVAGVAHFLNEGDKVQFVYADNDLIFDFATSSERLEQHQSAKDADKKAGTWRARTSKKCGYGDVIMWKQFNSKYVLKASAQTEFAINNKKQCSYSDLPFVISQ